MKEIFEGYLLVSDMDGTLLNSKKEISKENKEAIKYFVEEGGKFTVATGRMLSSVEEFIEELNIDIPAILHNGAKIYDYEKEKVISEHFIENHRKKAIKKVYEENPHIGIEIFSDEVVYIYRSCDLTKRYKKHNYNVIYDFPKDIWEKDWIKVLLIGTEEELDALEKEYKMKYDEGNAFRSGSNYFDIVANGVTKGRALKELIERYNMDSTKVVAVGDNMNDIEMLETASYGFCIKTGAERVLEKAKHIAPSNDNNPIDYVIKFMEKEIKKYK
ncbi:HAD family hydrolase [Clostridium sp. SHJSY1]|uniref:HAD family hydrolase n=1 Tax=Clostridium sp. SHJSY1 TaxID=2942483 RepID=UPI0028760C84|nr:HAD family hydrolase [Clostridium sp. SHJSY1]MDS0525376.1 HAD family hydrolase [Clostridium sp. SHJSY1]